MRTRRRRDPAVARSAAAALLPALPSGPAIAAAHRGRADTLSPADVLRLQRFVGNSALAPSLRGGPTVQRAPAAPAEPGCTYGPGEVAASRKPAGLRAPDVSMPLAPQAVFDPVLVSDFPVGRATPSAATLGELRSGGWIPIVERQASKKLQFIGYTDCVGEAADNSDLRDRRAGFVANLFPKAKANATLIGGANAGEYVTSNADRAGRAGNRGVLIRTQPAAPPVKTPTPTPAAKKPTEPAKPKKPYGKLQIQDATRYQVDLIRIAAIRAIQMLDAAIPKLAEPLDPVATNALAFHFKNVVRTFVPPKVFSLGRIVSDLETIRDAFSGTVPIEVEHERDGTTVAYVYRWLTDIHLNPAWFHKPSNDARAETLIHEAAHKYLDITDDTYRWETAAYAALSLSDSLDNADCFSELVYDLR